MSLWEFKSYGQEQMRSQQHYDHWPSPEDAAELMTYEVTIPYKERGRFESFLLKIGFPVSSLKKVVSRAAVF
jgi:hypothetical protein